MILHFKTRQDKDTIQTLGFVLVSFVLFLIYYFCYLRGFGHDGNEWEKVEMSGILFMHKIDFGFLFGFLSLCSHTWTNKTGVGSVTLTIRFKNSKLLFCLITILIITTIASPFKTRHSTHASNIHNILATGFSKLFILFSSINPIMRIRIFNHRKRTFQKHSRIAIYSIPAHNDFPNDFPKDNNNDFVHITHFDCNTNILDIQRFFDLYNIAVINNMSVSYNSNIIVANVSWNTQNQTFLLFAHLLHTKTHIRIPRSNVVIYKH